MSNFSRPASRSFRTRRNSDASVEALLESVLTTAQYLLYAAVSGVFLWFLYQFWSHDILMSFHDIQGIGLSADGLHRVWFIFAWAFGATLLFGIVMRVADTDARESSRTVDVLKGWWISINAGVFEEIIWRWMVFFSAMVMLRLVNFVTFGLCKWFYVHALIPLANFFTLHALDAQLHDPRSWVVGAAIVSASMDFRDKHEYLGIIGWVNSWFIGMVMFWLVFHYGLLTAIVAHIVYDVIVFTTAALLAARE